MERPRGEVEYHLPDSWDVTTYNFAGANRPVLSPAQIKLLLTTPIGRRASRILRGAKKVSSSFLRTWRAPARLSRVVPVSAGRTRRSKLSKWSDRVYLCKWYSSRLDPLTTLKRNWERMFLQDFLFFNHCPFINCTPLGRQATELGLRWIPKSCLVTSKITLRRKSDGTVVTVLAGEGKLFMPGVSSYDAIAEHHMLTP